MSRNVTRPARTERPISATFVALVAALGGLLFGYDTGVVSGALLFLKDTFHLSPGQQEIAVSSVLVGAIIGALGAGQINNILGRRKTLLLLGVVFTIGAILIAVAPNFPFFLVWRVIIGLAIGAAASVVPVYISEMSPPKSRGALVSLNQLAVTLGIAISYWADLGFARANLGWRPMFATSAIPGIILFLGMLMSPETPRWLASKGRWTDAERVLRRIKGIDPERGIAEIHQSLLEEEQRAIGAGELFKPGLRRALLVGMGIAAIQQLVGINTVIYYAPTIFQAAGAPSASSAILATSIVGVVNVLATIVSLFLVDRLGRRPLLLIGTAALAIVLFFMGLFFTPQFASHVRVLILVALICYIIAFAISLGPVFWLMSAEIFPTRVRAIGASLCSFTNWLLNFVVSISFLSLVNAIGQTWTFWIYAILSVLGFIFCLKLVPETKGRTLEQIEHYWMQGPR
uniref:MFS transporter n=1 Tax=Thermosporothrix sp. COM3 TaxID=2490863 RepID=A0A455SDQ4_9CHLR|nr:MFS transporter [Thermosporothrix sp. COM3]